MAHELETWGGGRSASFVSARQHATIGHPDPPHAGSSISGTTRP